MTEVEGWKIYLPYIPLVIHKSDFTFTWDYWCIIPKFIPIEFITKDEMEIN